MIRSALFRNTVERSFESLYRRHAKDVYRYSRAMLQRQADAEDATQTVFLNAYRALERGERPRDSGKWLRAIALNVCREHYRRARRRPAEVPLEPDPGELVIDSATPEIGDLIRGLSCLPFSQRAALVMREFEGRSLREIATALDVSPAAVEALLFRARRGLREQLEGALTCGEAEAAISRQLDGALPRDERGPLRAHLRQCEACASLARRMRGQRKALRSLCALIPVPASLVWSRAAPAGGSLFSAAAGSAATKLAVAAVGGAIAIGGYVELTRPARRVPARAAETSAASARIARVTLRVTRSGALVPAGGQAPAGSAAAVERGRAPEGRGAARPLKDGVLTNHPPTAASPASAVVPLLPIATRVHAHQRSKSSTGHHSSTAPASSKSKGQVKGKTKPHRQRPAAKPTPPKKPTTSPGQLKPKPGT